MQKKIKPAKLLRVSDFVFVPVAIFEHIYMYGISIVFFSLSMFAATSTTSTDTVLVLRGLI